MFCLICSAVVGTIRLEDVRTRSAQNTIGATPLQNFDPSTVRLSRDMEVDGVAMEQEIKQETQLQMQRALKIQSAEAEDDHAAKTAERFGNFKNKKQKTQKNGKLANPSAGRPRKTKTEFKNDISKMLRDRANSIKDAVENLNTAMSTVKENAIAALGPEYGSKVRKIGF